jgi:hypothetical protein
MVDSDENEKFKDLLNEYLDFENEFLENLLWFFLRIILYKKRNEW